VKAVDKVIAKGKKIAAHLLEASDADIEFANGEFRVAGTDRKKTFAEVALTAYVPHNYPLDKLEPGLNENAFLRPDHFTYPAGTYICEVEVDPRRGGADRSLRRGRRLRQRGQPDDRRGTGARRAGAGHWTGAARGLFPYNEDGQLVTGSYMDYAMPRPTTCRASWSRR